MYQDPCKALQCLATSQVMRTRQARHCNANDRLRNTSRVTYNRDIGRRACGCRSASMAAACALPWAARIASGAWVRSPWQVRS